MASNSGPSRMTYSTMRCIKHSSNLYNNALTSAHTAPMTSPRQKFRWKNGHGVSMDQNTPTINLEYNRLSNISFIFSLFRWFLQNAKYKIHNSFSVLFPIPNQVMGFFIKISDQKTHKKGPNPTCWEFDGARWYRVAGLIDKNVSTKTQQMGYAKYKQNYKFCPYNHVIC